MCGFIGIVGKGNQPFPEDTLRRMAGMIVHRGPASERRSGTHLLLRSLGADWREPLRSFQPKGGLTMAYLSTIKHPT